MKRHLLTILLLISCSPDSNPNLDAYWNEPPIIEFCDDVPLDSEYILDQFDWFHYEISNSYSYQYVIYSSCEEDRDLGVIRVKLANPKTLERLGAAAYVNDFEIEKHNGRYIMLGATINLTEFNLENAIRHEIGHAYGWNHFSDEEHLMSGNGGWKTYGLDNYPG